MINNINNCRLINNMALVGVRASYHRILNNIELRLPAKLRPFYNHPAGPKTVFFWAPVCKWVRVRNSSSGGQNIFPMFHLHLSCHYSPGVIWSRYSLVIIPKNWGLFFVNSFVGLAGANQLVRIWMYQHELKKQQEENNSSII
uniref:Mitochondrial pyruvate carrier n=1 Tax=Esox lucius TaxID=8010 RepID=A0A3P8XF52_ESOLU